MSEICKLPVWTGACQLEGTLMLQPPAAPVFKIADVKLKPEQELQCFKDGDKARAASMELCARKFDCTGWKPGRNVKLEDFLKQSMMHYALQDDNFVHWDDLMRLSLVLAEFAVGMQRDQYCKEQAK